MAVVKLASPVLLVHTPDAFGRVLCSGAAFERMPPDDATPRVMCSGCRLLAAGFGRRAIAEAPPA